VLAAAGTTGAAFEPAPLSVAINGVWVCRDGAPWADRSGVDLRPSEVTVTIDLAVGQTAATVLTTDLTPEYVHENSAYST
jgi:glutamate N-acetyltransferase/amino-acid N-acetyltransferase